MACENLSKDYSIVMIFSGYLPFYEETSAIDFGPNRSIRLAVHGPKVRKNELDCASGCKLDRNFQVSPLRLVQ